MELEHFGYPEAKHKLGNLGTAMLFDTRHRGVGWSSAAAEMRKIIGVKKSTLSGKLARVIRYKVGARKVRGDNMKKCPYCAEEIQDEAIKCRHCGEFLKKKKKWFNCCLGCLIGIFGFIVLINVFIMLFSMLLKVLFFRTFHPPVNYYEPAVFGPGLQSIWNELIDGIRLFWERITF